jgi:DNA-binding transcriptional MerR regulator
MEYRVEELAAAAGVAVDTVRFYQSQRLLPPPARRGRVVWYDESHLDRLRRIRDLKRQRLTLDQIRRVVERPEQQPLLTALVEESRGGQLFTRRELAAAAGVPEPLILAAESAGLLEPVVLDGEPRFSEADVEMARSGLRILEAGFPMQALLAVAMLHRDHVVEVCERAIDLFDANVRKHGAAERDPEAISEAFHTLLPQVTILVARHFQRTLVTRAMARLSQPEEREALAAAVAATESARLDVTWR